MRGLRKATIYRMAKQTGVRVAFLCLLLAATFYYVLCYVLGNSGAGARDMNSMSALADPMMISMFGSLLVGLLIGTDFENKTIHGAIRQGRQKIYLNYLIMYVIIILLAVAPYILGSVICILTGADMTGAAAATVSVSLFNVLSAGDVSFGKLLLSYIAFAVVYVGQLSLAIPIAVKVKKPMVVFVVGTLFEMLTAAFTSLASKVEILDNIYRLTPYAYMVDKIGCTGTVADMVTGIVVSIVFTVLMSVVGWLLFKKTEIK